MCYCWCNTYFLKLQKVLEMLEHISSSTGTTALSISLARETLGMMNPDLLAHRKKMIKSCSCLNHISCSSSQETLLPGTLKNYNTFYGLQLKLTFKSTLTSHVLELEIRSVLMAFLQ